MVFFLASCTFSFSQSVSSNSVSSSDEPTDSFSSRSSFPGSSQASSSDEGSLENGSSQAKADYYRIAPVAASITDETCPVYDVSYSDGKYTGTVVSTLSRSQDCLTYEQVCLYYQAFRALPPNYKSSKGDALEYGRSGRCYSPYHKGDYSGSSDYTVALGNFRKSTGLYLELDIDLTGSYNNGKTISRGTGRVVVVVDGISDYEEEPVCYFTSDHYADFIEFYNFEGGWSPLFVGANGGKASPNSVLKRPIPETVCYVNA